jgi:hypothetical protein
MKKDFTFYEFTGVLVPGATLLIGVGVVTPSIKEFLLEGEFGAGYLGLFAVGSYIVGHLVQGVGNLLEKIVWAFRGMPTDWVCRKKCPYLNPDQIESLQTVLTSILGYDPGRLPEMDKKICKNLRGQIYATLQKEGNVSRIDTFSGNYGMFRGISSSALVLLAAATYIHGLKSAEVMVCLVVLMVSLMRMHRFGVHYASEIYRQALALNKCGGG